MASTQTPALTVPRRARQLPMLGVAERKSQETPAHNSAVLGVRKVLYIALAGIFFVLAMIGVVLPGLPTTPFLLLTSFFLARSWPRMNQRLMENKLCGPILRRFQRGTAAG